MPEYRAPIKEINFVFNDLLTIESHYQNTPGCAEVTPDLIEAILEEAGKFAATVLQPINAIGDEQGCHWDDGAVTTPDGFKAAYDQYKAAGWTGVTFDEAYGGQGLPYSLGTALSEMVSAANSSWGMYPGLTAGAIHAIAAHGSDEQKQRYLPKMVAGDWTGTMCLTEAHCGSDLGMLRTKATPLDDGSYAITGSKIFISAGEHDMSDNIIHLVLARLPGAPSGTKGISLFIVPKYRIAESGDVAANDNKENGVSCGSIEHKMGINGSSTCVINFDNAQGFLIGPENRGLNCMFTMMNVARLGTAMQGLAIAEASLQGATAYARERLQGRSLSGVKAPDKAADPIIVHPDVRRMLLTMKAFTEGNRALGYFTAKEVDIAHRSTDKGEATKADKALGFLTPICKAFFTETGFEVTNHGVQVLGGHGYIKEWGMEQLVRDCRITMIYEGTTGIQALDLIGRKVLADKGEGLRQVIAHIMADMEKLPESLSDYKKTMMLTLAEWGELGNSIGKKAMDNADEIGAASFDFLMYSGYVCLAWQWANMAAAASVKITQGSDDSFYQGKLQTARFYFERIFPRAQTHKNTLLSGAGNLMAMAAEDF